VHRRRSETEQTGTGRNQGRRDPSEVSLTTRLVSSPSATSDPAGLRCNESQGLEITVIELGAMSAARRPPRPVRFGWVHEPRVPTSSTPTAAAAGERTQSAGQRSAGELYLLEHDLSAPHGPLARLYLPGTTRRRTAPAGALVSNGSEALRFGGSGAGGPGARGGAVPHTDEVRQEQHRRRAVCANRLDPLGSRCSNSAVTCARTPSRRSSPTRWPPRAPWWPLRRAGQPRAWQGQAIARAPGGDPGGPGRRSGGHRVGRR
jgi:hypothetical protein